MRLGGQLRWVGPRSNLICFPTLGASASTRVRAGPQDSISTLRTGGKERRPGSEVGDTGEEERDRRKGNRYRER